MSKYPYRQDREDIKALLQQYENLKSGLANSFLEEESFERLIEYFDENEQLAEALEVSAYAISQYPYSSSLLLHKADLLIALRHYREALQVCDQAALLDSREADLYILKTDAYLALDQQEKAAAVLESVIGDFDGEEKIELLFELADVYDDYEIFDKVFDCLKLILEQEPGNEEALHKICFWTDFTGRNEEGIRLHQKIIDELPFSELAWFNLAAAYQGLKLYEKAIDAYQYAVAIDDKFDYAWRNMGDAYLRLRKYKDAIEVLQKVLELASPEDVIYEAIGHCYDKMGHFAQARFNYKKASHLNQGDSQLHYKIACTYMNESNWNSAVKSMETALQMHKMQPEYNLAIGQCYMEMGRYDEAISCFGNVVRVRPKNVSGWVELLKCLYRSSLFEEALDYAGMAFEQTEGKTIFLFYKSIILFAMGQSKEAVLYLEHGMQQNPRLIRKVIDINPALLQNQQVVDVIARFKKRKSL
ncbi:MAG: tetratricopeptide repeat protein [Bacteroidetes bacterium]|nr:tetratricopeptide repeat protein [Bacteroidota bacterium]